MAKLVFNALYPYLQALQSYTNIYGQVTCYAEAIVKPDSTQQLAAAVKQFVAAASAASKPLKIRTSRRSGALQQ